MNVRGPLREAVHQSGVAVTLRTRDYAYARSRLAPCPRSHQSSLSSLSGRAQCLRRRRRGK